MEIPASFSSSLDQRVPHNEQPTHPNEQAHRHRRNSAHTPRISRVGQDAMRKDNSFLFLVCPR